MAHDWLKELLIWHCTVHMMCAQSPLLHNDTVYVGVGGHYVHEFI